MKDLLSAAEKKAHGFRGRCNLHRHHIISALPEYLRREYADKGWAKGTRNVRLKNGDYQWMEVFLEPLCDGFETTDRAAFEDHMKTVHGKKTVYGEAWSKSIRRGWVSPKAKAEGSPLTKTLAAQLETCPSCGMSAEVGGRYGDQLWWDEHLRGCRVARSA